MSRALDTHRIAQLALPTLLACGAASIVVCAIVLRRAGSATVARAEAVGAASAVEPTEAVRVAVDAHDDPIDEPGELDAPRSDVHGELVERETATPDALDTRAADVLKPGVARAEQIALLRALYDSGEPSALAWFEHAVRNLPDDSSPDGESTASFAVGFLYDRAELNAPARRTLARLAADSERVAPAFRARAVARVAQLGDPDELRELQIALRGEQHPTVLANALAALDSRRDDSNALSILREHGRDAAPSESSAQRAR